MHTALWVVQIVLAVAFAAAGVMKATQPTDKLVANMAYVEDFSTGTVKLIGVAEFAAALGLVLPAVIGIAVVLTPLAAVGLAVLMVLAAIVHAHRGEWSSIPINVVLFAGAAFVAWGRFGPHAF